MIKTDDEIQALKDSWVRNPNWDVEDTEGFEQYKDELLRFRMEIEEFWKKRDAERHAQRVRMMSTETGIDDPSLADNLYTFQEIEADLKYKTQESPEASSTESAQLAVMRAQVRATLLLAAQSKRIADLLEDAIENMEGDSNQTFTTNLYKVD